MPPAIPRNKPNADYQLWIDRLKAAGYNPDELFPASPVLVVAIRGLFSGMGTPGENDTAIFDDAIAMLTRDGTCKTWNANTDPTRYGWNAGAGKYMARLCPGAWWMHRRRHGASRPGGGYMAFGQCDRPVTVERVDSSGKVREKQTGCFGIDLHKAGNTTSSEGCQTVPLEQWPSMDVALPHEDWFRYILIDIKSLPAHLH